MIAFWIKKEDVETTEGHAGPPLYPVPIQLKSILYLANSNSSETALSYAVAVHQRHGAKIHVLHVLIAAGSDSADGHSSELSEETWEKLRGIERALKGTDCEVTLKHGPSLWPIVERFILDQQIDVVISSGEMDADTTRVEVFRLSPAPVLSVGPLVQKHKERLSFARILVATDFTPDASCAFPHALSLARDYHSQIVLMHVLPTPSADKTASPFDRSVAEVIHQLDQTIPQGAYLPFAPEVAVQFGKPSEQILGAAQERSIDLIVLGVRSGDNRFGTKQHHGRGTARRVIAESHVPVLTVRA